MKHIKTILVLSLGLNLIASFFVAKRLYWKYYASNSVKVNKEGNNTRLTYWLNRQELFEVLPKDSNAIIFLGNSLTQNFELAELFQNINIKNRGINGDITAGVLNRLTPIIQTKPKKIFIEIGINDLGNEIPKDSVIVNYKKILFTLQKECKSTKIYIQSILPVENDRDGYPTYCNPKVNGEIKEINKELLKYANQNNITFIDTYSKFELGGQLNPKHSVDGIHISGDGYLLWTKILKPFVDE
jgi:lysophospholipase L1-like esterase